jgi:predicted amidohydrolase YtcJ
MLDRRRNAAELLETEVLYTIVDGKIVYQDR